MAVQGKLTAATYKFNMDPLNGSQTVYSFKNTFSLKLKVRIKYFTPQDEYGEKEERYFISGIEVTLSGCAQFIAEDLQFPEM